VITCPDDIIVDADGAAEVNFTVTAEDACGIKVAEVVCTPPSGSMFPVGTSTVNCMATDVNGNTATCSFDVTVNRVNQPPSVAADQPTVEVDEGQTANITGTVGDPDGDAVTLSASVGTVTNVGNGTWSWSFPTSDGPAESQTVTIDADDGNGGVAMTTFGLTVNNVAPTVDAIMVPPDPIDINDQPVTGVSATFSDPANTSDEPYTCTVDYDDGGGPQAGTVAGTTCTGPNQTFAEPGVYAVTVTVTDKDNDSGSATATEFIVIYDPSGGFVTGGGWIDSPAGACPVFCDDATGKANFGFVSKYKKGASTPTGQTEFQFKAGDLNFHSTSYDWLVIAGAKAMYKGDGTVNGTDGFTFQLNAIDGQVNGGGDVDKFRIKIKQTDGDVIYDNQMGAGDDDDPTTGLGGGNIKIHKGISKIAVDDGQEELLSETIPESYGLEQNYPNPFNPTTEIAFGIPEAGEVKLAIFNLSGQLVRTLVSGQLSAGNHRVTWNATDERGQRVASGIYLYVLKAGSVTIHKRLVLMK
jgi:hypothetical protein